MGKTSNIQSRSANIVCPFYQNDNFNSIRCEGYYKKSSLRSIFSSKETKDKHRNSFCEKLNNYKNCPFCRLAEEKYND